VKPNEPRNAIKTAAVDRRPLIISVAVLTSILVLFIATFVKADGHVIKSHGYSYFGGLKYSANFKHLDYVNPDAPRGGEISTWGFGTFDSMNPYSRKGRAAALSSAPFESLLTGTADEVGSNYGLLAESIEYPKGVPWAIFTLRPEAKFSDASLVSSADVVFTYELFLSEGLPSYKAVLGQIVESVEAIGTNKVKYTFRADSPERDRIPTVGGLPVMSQAWMVENDAGLEESRMEPAIGSGQYVLDSYEINRWVKYKRNPEYWGNDLPINRGRGNFDYIRYEYFADGNSAFEGFKSGAYTFKLENSSKTWATGYDFPALDDGHVIKKILPSGGIASGQSFAMNLRREKFADPRVREALGYLFNFEWSNESLFYGQYARVNSFWENSDFAATGKPTPRELALLTPIADKLPDGILTDDAVMAETSGLRASDRKNLRAASALLDAAGWAVGDDGLRRNSDGGTLKIEFLERSPAFDRVVLPYVENLKAVGVDAVYNRVDPAQYTDRTRNHDFDVITDQFRMSMEPGSSLQQYFGSKTADESVFNSMGLKSEGVDVLIDHVANATTKGELRTSVRALDRALRAYRFWVPQWYNATHRVAYWDMYEHPVEIAPYSLGQLDYWWYNAEKAEALKSSGALR
jgi:microcin C transport system substrate-binding protein